MSLCLQGNREAQSLLYISYYRKMLKIIRQYVADPDLAQDVLHDGFIVILSQLKSLREPERLDYWMATIMKNLAIHSLSQLQFDSILEENVEDEETTEEEFISFDELAKYIDLLPTGCQAVFRLAVLEGKSHKEIGEMLGISPKSSASQLARAKERLRQIIRENKGITFVSLFLLVLVGIGLLKVRFREDKSFIMADGDSSPIEDIEALEAYQSSDTKPGIQHTTPRKQHNQRVAIAFNPVATQPGENIVTDGEPPIFETRPEDNVYQKCDSINVIELIDIPAVLPEKEKVDISASAKESNFKLSIASNMLAFGSNPTGGTQNDAMSDPSTGDNLSPGDYNTSVRHLMPITFSLRISRDVSERLSLETGLQYTLLRSELNESIGDWSCVENISAHFVSVPLGIRYSFLDRPSFNLYGKCGVGIGLPIKSKIESDEIDLGESFHCPVDFSTSLSIGIEYRFAPSTSLFIEPSLNYHFLGDTKYPILWNDKPLSFELPLGIRLTW